MSDIKKRWENDLRSTLEHIRERICEVFAVLNKRGQGFVSGCTLLNVFFVLSATFFFSVKVKARYSSGNTEEQCFTKGDIIDNVIFWHLWKFVDDFCIVYGFSFGRNLFQIVPFKELVGSRSKENHLLRQRVVIPLRNSASDSVALSAYRQSQRRPNLVFSSMVGIAE